LLHNIPIGLFPNFHFRTTLIGRACPQVIVNHHTNEQLPPGSSKPSAPQNALREL
jgi:hypothetical protein